MEIIPEYVFSDLTAWPGAFQGLLSASRGFHNADRSGWCCQVVRFEPLNPYYYASNNTAVVQVFRSDLVDEYGDYQGDFVIEYHAVNLETQTTQKLDIPLSKYPRRAMQLLDDGTVAIVGNTQSEGNNIYIFDPSDNSVTQGVSYEGAEFINSLLVY